MIAKALLCKNKNKLFIGEFLDYPVFFFGNTLEGVLKNGKRELQVVRYNARLIDDSITKMMDQAYRYQSCVASLKDLNLNIVTELDLLTRESENLQKLAEVNAKELLTRKSSFLRVVKFYMLRLVGSKKAVFIDSEER
jgi:hypothetical protein